MKMKCLIIDDEQLARKLLENFVSKLPNLELVGMCKSPLEAMAVMQEQDVDLLFLDIQMPDLTGIEFLKTMSNSPMVIFTTAYSEYALESYEFNVIDYLLKPFSFERFLKAVQKANAIFGLKQQPKESLTKNIEKIEDDIKPIKEQDYLMIKSDHRIYKTYFKDILYIEGLKEYVSFYTPSQRIISLQSLSKLEDSLPKEQFIRTHRSYIVSLSQIKAIEGNQLEINGKLIPIGKTYKDGLLNSLGLI
ncbi:LytR/AlgR family response regulator transcription factor [Sediminitomix flava]|uniref:LytTR family two component transcriptional regulator n=1 Tax=Sediminitomix flava TaxID=379075 RepID=A0A315ZGX4_SEDFL|nr:LytTR family DNA-binding domain-containing protein [Sediminitomix flava]PWJ44836.1 LytTR family two component transcriptional regulator [Sediminitomix flava]